MPRKSKKSERKRLTGRLDELCRKIVRKRDGNKCQKCGKHVEGHDSHPSHVIPKGKGASQRRFDLLNIKLLCFSCHRNWWHKNPLEAAEWFKEKFPARDAYLGIYRGGKPAKITTDEMWKLKDTLKQKLKDLQGESQ